MCYANYCLCFCIYIILSIYCNVYHFTRENVDWASDELKYEEEILTEVSELKAESEGEYQKKLAEYHKQLEEWKLWRKKQVPVWCRQAQCIPPDH